jgi:drug/metabolite transporter (DMT)-like permease
MLWVTLAWGACFVAIRWGLRDAPVLWFAALRAGVAGAALLALARWQHRPALRGARSWGLVAALGAVNGAIAFAAMFGGVAGLATGTAAVLANAQPLLILLPAWWLYGERITGRTAAGLAVGFAGLLVVAIPGGGGDGAALSLVAAAAITAGTLLARRLGSLDLVVASGWHFVIGGAALTVWAAAVEGWPSIDWTPRFVVVLAFLSLVGTAAAFLAWFTETLRSPLGLLAAWTFLVPIAGVAFAALLLREAPTGWTAIGIALVLASMWVVLHPGPDAVNA